MLTDKRVKEAESNVKLYLEEGLLKKDTYDKNIITTFLENAKESLRVAELIKKENKSDLWIIVCSYYSMFYYANAALLTQGYKVKEKIVHKVTSDSLIVFIRNKLKETLIEEYESMKEEALNLAGIKADNILESYENERNKRNTIQYKTLGLEKKKKAETSLQRAKEFSKEIEKIII